MRTITFTVNVSPVFRRTGVRRSKSMLPSSLDLNLVNLITLESFATKMYRQEIRQTDHLNRLLLHCWLG